MTRPPRCCFRVEDFGGFPRGWLWAPSGGATTVLARSRSEIPSVLDALDRAAAEDRFAVLALDYEAAPALDSAMRTRAPGSGTLAVCCVFDRPPEHRSDLPPADSASVGEWTSEMDAAAHARAVAAIRERIAAGDTYQVNLTFRLRGAAPRDPWGLFRALWRAHPVAHAAWLDLGERCIASLSPELFFAVTGEEIVCRPMKGTAPRGRWFEEDIARRAALAGSAKDRAENVMILDMVRNDLGRIARPGTVRAESLFDIETYRSVFQMTSTVRARADAPPSAILRALFPCASITGAPKVSAMRIIEELEQSPRGIYCGALGFVAPGRRMKFCVPIRTLTVFPADGRAEYGVGGGIVWDSTAPSEFAEAFHKSRALTRPDPPFKLLETMRWRRGRGVFLWREHFTRLSRSAAYFGFASPDEPSLRSQLNAAAEAVGEHSVRVRLRYDGDGRVTVEAHALPIPDESRPIRAALDDRPTDSDTPWLYHKTTRREIYAAARARRPDAEEVILWNPAGEVMEGTIANVIARLDGVWVTPPVESGLLPGCLRERLLRRGCVRERRITVEELRRAEQWGLANSVRGLRWAHLIRD